MQNKCNIAFIGPKECGKQEIVALITNDNSTRQIKTSDVSFFGAKIENIPVGISTIDLSEEHMLQLPFIACSCDWFFLCHQLNHKKSFAQLEQYFPKLKIPKNKVTLISLKNESINNKDLEVTQLTRASYWADHQKIPHFALNWSEDHWYSIKKDKNLMKLKKRTQKKNTINDFFSHMLNHHPWQKRSIT